MYLLKNGCVIDPKSKFQEICDILIYEDKIVSIEKEIDKRRLAEIREEKNLAEEHVEQVDATGKVVAPGLVDVHVHFRDPGYTYKEDLASGSNAAKRGGYTTVVLMANTNPVGDSQQVMDYIYKEAEELPIHIKTCACVTKGLRGKELTDMDALLDAGAVGFTDDGIPILSEEILETAMKKTGELNVPISLHEEDPKYIRANGVDDELAKEFFHLGGSPKKAEYSIIERDIQIALKTNAILDVQHVSTKESVELIRKARQKSKRIYGEATPHHFSMTSQAIKTKGTLAKMNPPLRGEEDRLAIIEGLKDGSISIIATDHAPHSTEEKARGFFKAPSGIIGIETALSTGLKFLVETGQLTLMQLLEKMTCNPAALYGFDAGEIRENGPADLVIFAEKELEKYEESESKSANSPLLGEVLPGVVYYTMVDGRIVYDKRKSRKRKSADE